MTTTDDILDLRRRVEALEQRATPAPDPAPAPAADRPLWRVVHEAWSATGAAASDATGYAAEIDAMADWFDSRGCHGAAHDLRAEAQRAREGA